MTAHYEYVPPVSHASGPASQIRVLIAGDHDCLRSSLKTMLELDPRIRVVGEAADDCETIKLAQRVRPDVVLIDLDMRCCDKYDALAEITQRRLANSVVGLSIHDQAGERAEAQAAGVNLFLEKGVPYKQLISAIRLAASTTPR
jgi:DNA-binding NarL/FixJ family response regulator